MPVFNFKEIPESHVATGLQDEFELFARDFLDFLGYEIVEHPSRGVDGGKDLIVEEIRKGISGETRIRWLVSCKHKAHSGKAIGIDEEVNILDRVKSKGCHGFIGFYSTLPSSGLAARLQELRSHAETLWFDRERIEKRLIDSPAGLLLARRYFPVSVAAWKAEHPEPAELWEDVERVACEYCEKDLVEQMRNDGPARSLITFWRNPQNSNQLTRTDELHWTCKGNCDFALSETLKSQGLCYKGWQDLSEYFIPTYFLRTVMVVINNAHNGLLGDTALEKFKDLLLAAYPFVSRNLTSAEQERMGMLLRIPPYFGGF